MIFFCICKKNIACTFENIKITEIPFILHDWPQYKQKLQQTVIYSDIYLKRCNFTQFILAGICSTCFGWYLHPSSGAQTTVSTASGISQTVTAICHFRGRV